MIVYVSSRSSTHSILQIQARFLYAFCCGVWLSPFLDEPPLPPPPPPSISRPPPPGNQARKATYTTTELDPFGHRQEMRRFVVDVIVEAAMCCLEVSKVEGEPRRGGGRRGGAPVAIPETNLAGRSDTGLGAGKVVVSLRALLGEPPYGTV